MGAGGGCLIRLEGTAAALQSCHQAYLTEYAKQLGHVSRVSTWASQCRERQHYPISSICNQLIPNVCGLGVTSIALSHERLAESQCAKCVLDEATNSANQAEVNRGPWSMRRLSLFSARCNCRTGCCHGTSRGRDAKGRDVFIYSVQWA